MPGHPSNVGPSRGLRIDAVRNREQIVESACRVFTADGLDAPMGTIAKEAGVGAATLYRRFPQRDGLVEACMTGRMNAYLVAARAALANTDPWEGFVGFLTAACAAQANDRGVNDLLTRSFPTARRLEGPRRMAYEAIEEVMARAKNQGQLRQDVTVDDIPLLLMANAGIVQATFGTAPDAWRRVLGITINGLRAGECTPLARAPSRRQLLRSMVRSSARPTSSATSKGVNHVHHP